MWSTLTGLFGSSKTTEKIVDGVVDGLDALVFTDEERSAANMKVLEFKLKYAATTQGQNVARRIIACGITLMWILVGLMYLALVLLGKPDMAKAVYDFLKDVVMTPFSIILGFYFLTHLVSRGKT